MGHRDRQGYSLGSGYVMLLSFPAGGGYGYGGGAKQKQGQKKGACLCVPLHKYFFTDRHQSNSRQADVRRSGSCLPCVESTGSTNFGHRCLHHLRPVLSACLSGVACAGAQSKGATQLQEVRNLSAACQRLIVSQLLHTHKHKHTSTSGA